MNELETIVSLFKRQCKEKPNSEVLKYQLENIELDDNEEAVYAKRYNTELKTKTIFSEDSPYIMIEKIEVQDGGYFGRNYLKFTITVPSKSLKVVRTEPCFKWLISTLETEYPFVPLPPLLTFYDPNFEKQTLCNY